MIPRYSRPEMVALWTPERRFQTWLQIAVLACEARAARGEIPQDALKTIQAKARFDVTRNDESERAVQHDKAASWYSELVRARDRLARAIEVISYGKISGAVGTYANCPPEVEAYVCARLGLSPEPVSTQVVPRDRHAEYFAQLALIAGAIER